MSDFEEKFGDKANKQSVAQALHRKANRAEIDALLAKKADLVDLQRVITALESKIDVSIFDSLVKTVEQKADRGDTSHHGTSRGTDRGQELERTVY